MNPLLPLAAAGASGFVLAATAAAAPPAVLTGTVGPGFTISLTHSGKKVTQLKAGMVKLVVRDRSAVHNFVLEGPGVERDVTTVTFQGIQTATVRLRPGRYKFYCRPHESSMYGFVTVK